MHWLSRCTIIIIIIQGLRRKRLRLFKSPTSPGVCQERVHKNKKTHIMACLCLNLESKSVLPEHKSYVLPLVQPSWCCALKQAFLLLVRVAANLSKVTHMPVHFAFWPCDESEHEITATLLEIWGWGGAALMWMNPCHDNKKFIMRHGSIKIKMLGHILTLSLNDMFVSPLISQRQDVMFQYGKDNHHYYMEYTAFLPGRRGASIQVQPSIHPICSCICSKVL
jgi:hypothetical protein